MTPLDRSVSVPGRGVSQFTNYGTLYTISNTISDLLHSESPRTAL